MNNLERDSTNKPVLANQMNEREKHATYETGEKNMHREISNWSKNSILTMVVPDTVFGSFL